MTPHGGGGGASEPAGTGGLGPRPSLRNKHPQRKKGAGEDVPDRETLGGGSGRGPCRRLKKKKAKTKPRTARWKWPCPCPLRQGPGTNIERSSDPLPPSWGVLWGERQGRGAVALVVGAPSWSPRGQTPPTPALDGVLLRAWRARSQSAHQETNSAAPGPCPGLPVPMASAKAQALLLLFVFISLFHIHISHSMEKPESQAKMV